MCIWTKREGETDKQDDFLIDLITAFSLLGPIFQCVTALSLIYLLTLFLDTLNGIHFCVNVRLQLTMINVSLNLELRGS